MHNVSIIIVNYNTKQLLRECLQSIYDKTAGISYEIIVVDNNSSDNSGEMIRQEFPSVRLIRSSTNLGFGKANNLGVENAQGEYLFFLNSDTILLNNAIKILYDYQLSHNNVGMCGGHLYTQNLAPACSDAKIPSIKRELRIFLPKRWIAPEEFHLSDSSYEVKCIIGADILIKKELFTRIKGFNPDFFMYAEEVELSCRIRKEGYGVFIVPQAKIIHLEGMSGESISESFKKSTYSIRWYSKFVFFRLAYHPWQASFVYSIHIFKCMLAMSFYSLYYNKKRIQYWQEKYKIIKRVYCQYLQFYREK